MNKDIGLFEVLLLLGIMRFYIWAKISIYSREYGTKKNKRDVLIRRGAEWDYKKENQNENK